MIVPPTRQDTADAFRLIHGLLRAHVLDGVPIERLAADYGFTPARLRTKLLDHVAACFVAVEGPTVEPEAAPVVPTAEPTPAVVLPTPRIRERIQIAPSAPAVRTRVRAIRTA